MSEGNGVAIEAGDVFKVKSGRDKTLDAHYLTFRQHQKIRNFHDNVDKELTGDEQCEAMLRTALPRWDDEQIEDLLEKKIMIQQIPGIVLQIIQCGEVGGETAKKSE